MSQDLELIVAQAASEIADVIAAAAAATASLAPLNLLIMQFALRYPLSH